MSQNVNESHRQPERVGPWGVINPLEWAPAEEVDSVSLSRAQLNPRRGMGRANPVTRPEQGLIRKATRVGSMGSCFSIRIQDWLVRHGYHYVCTEPEPRPLDEAMFPGGWVRHTARFGVVYNTGCARQVFERALGRFSPRESFWPASYMGLPVLRDPYRYGVFWRDERDMRVELAAHAAAVREAIRACEVFIVTVGLAEVWRSTLDGAAFATAPPQGVHDPARHAFSLTGVEENRANLEAMYAAMREINPGVRMVLALSPMRMKATYQRVHWAQGNTVSKAVLRVAIHEFCQAHPEVVYFPSYEIITGMLTEGAYEEDAEHIKLRHVQRVMASFMAAYGDPAEVREALGDLEIASQPERDERDEQAERAVATERLALGLAAESPAAIRYLRDQWRRLGLVYGERPIVIVGGGRHTQRLAYAVRSTGGPRVLAVLDDAPSAARIGDWVVRRFEEIEPSGVSAALISSDTIQETLARRARGWAGGEGVAIETLYDAEDTDRSGLIDWAHRLQHADAG